MSDATATATPKAPKATKPKAAKAPKAPKAAKGKASDARATEAAARNAANTLKQVSDPTRLQVVLVLADGPRNVGQLCEDLGGISQPAVSHHLALMRHGRLIMPVRDGKHNVYELTDSGRMLATVVKNIVANDGF
jgi:DNA-binding transcriptional ArsR family regulator